MNGSATLDSDAKDKNCNIGRGQINVVSQKFLNNRGQQNNSDTISIFSDFPERDKHQHDNGAFNLSSSQVQQRGRVETGTFNQSSGGNRSDKRQTVRNSIILDVSKLTDTPEVQIPEEEFSQGLTKRTPDSNPKAWN